MRLSLFWRVFAVNAGLLGGIALLLLLSPVEIDAPIKARQALIVVGVLVITLATNAVLLRDAFAPLERLARRMDTVDLLRPGQRLPVGRDDEVGRVVAAFNHMLDRLESERHENGSRALAAQEAERIGIARDLHDEVGQLLTAVLLQLNSIAETAPAHRVEIDEAREAVRRALDEVRRISRELRPEMLEQLGLVSALTELRRRSSERPACVSSASSTSAPAALPRYRARGLPGRAGEPDERRASRQGSHVTIALERSHDSVVLRVVDDGCGFGGAPVEHGGLRSMRERALSIDGALAVRDGAAGGVEVRLDVPTARVAHVARSIDADSARHADPDRRRLHARPRGPQEGARCQARPGGRRRGLDGAEAVDKALRDDVDLAILDISMPRMTGIQAAAELHRRKPELRIVILSMHDSDQLLFEALKAGASGYVLKSGADTDIVDAVRSAMLGQSFLYPSAVTTLVRDYVDHGGHGDEQFDVLTPRELDVLKLDRGSAHQQGDCRAAVHQRQDRRATPSEHSRQARNA